MTFMTALIGVGMPLITCARLAVDMPHVQNGYRLSFGEEVGVSQMQMEVARSDMLAHRPDAATANKVSTSPVATEDPGGGGRGAWK